MNIDALAKSMKSWVQVDTWHTTHPLDTERFNKAVAKAIADHGSQITYDDFKEAIERLVEQCHPEMAGKPYTEEAIERCAGNAEIIAGYVSDTS